MIEIPIPNRLNNAILQSDDNKRYYLVVNTKQQYPKWNGKKPAYMFTGDFTVDYHSFSPFWKLAEYIETIRAFVVGSDGLPYDRRKGEKDISLARVLLSFYSGVEIEETDNVNAQMVDDREVVLESLTDQEEIEFFKTHYVYNFTAGNLVSDVHGTEVCFNGNVFVAPPDMYVKCKGESFHTTYDQKLCKFLLDTPNWNVGSGALKTNISAASVDHADSKSKKSFFIPYANIVVAHHRGLIPYNKNNVRDKLKAIYDSITAKGLEIDHLSERKNNNYLHLLALTNKSVNGAAHNFRTRIKAPFFFYTVYDHIRERCLVHLGIEGTGWERYIVFNSLEDEESYKMYLECLKTFRDYADAAGCLMDKPGEESLLYYWAEPARMSDKANPLNQLLAKPLDVFIRYNKAVFWGIPTIERK